MRLQTCFPVVIAALLIPFSKGTAQVTPAPTVSSAPSIADSFSQSISCFLTQCRNRRSCFISRQPGPETFLLV